MDGKISFAEFCGKKTKAEKAFEVSKDILFSFVF